MITSRIIAAGILRAIGIITVIAIVCCILYKIQRIILYLVISLIFTLIGSRIKNFAIKKLKFNNLAATIATIVFFMLIILGLVLIFVPLILSQAESLSLLDTLEIKKGVVLLVNRINAFLNIHGIDADKVWNQSNLYANANFSLIPNFLNVVIGAITDFGIGLASVLFITFMFLKDKNLIIIGMRAILPDKHEEKILASVYKINALLARYFTGIIIQLLIVFTLYLAVLLAFDINNAAAIAFLSAILNIIPYLGPLIGTVLAAILTTIDCFGKGIQSEIVPTTIFVVIGYIFVHLIDSNISQPIIFSNSTKSHPLEIFLVILIAGFLFGIFGLIFAIPIYTILKVAGKEFFPENKIIQLLTQKM